jgi:hypothetical protein
MSHLALHGQPSFYRQRSRYHMRDQVHHRVRDIMRAVPGRTSPEPRLWPTAALVLAALTLANILIAAPAP